jgi:hypothetical protein
LTTGNLWLAAAGGTTTSATLNVSGAGSSVTTAPATSIIVGNSAAGSATVNLTAGGTISVGAGGSTTVNHTGVVNVSGGSLDAGTLINYGTLSITSGSVSADAMTQDPAGTLQIGIGGSVRGLQYGTLLASGETTLNGRLAVSLNGYSPVLGNYFNVVSWGSHSGAFSSVELPPLAGRLGWNADALYTNGTISVIDTNYLPGDFDRDGHVSVADVSSMMTALADLSGYKATRVLSTGQLRSLGDLTGDGQTTNADVQGLLCHLASVRYQAGDLNRDGHVDVADLASLEAALADLAAYQSSNVLTGDQVLAVGDVDGDGRVTNADVQALLVGLAASAGGGSSATAGPANIDAVPEPGSIVLMLVGLAAASVTRGTGRKSICCDESVYERSCNP